MLAAALGESNQPVPLLVERIHPRAPQVFPLPPSGASTPAGASPPPPLVRHCLCLCNLLLRHLTTVIRTPLQYR